MYSWIWKIYQIKVLEHLRSFWGRIQLKFMKTICWWLKWNMHFAWCMAISLVFNIKVWNAHSDEFSLKIFLLDLNEDFLMRKIQLCQNVINIYDKVDPGRTNQRTNAIFELNCARIIECQRKYARNLINKSDALVSRVFFSHQQSDKWFLCVYVHRQ